MLPPLWITQIESMVFGVLIIGDELNYFSITWTLWRREGHKRPGWSSLIGFLRSTWTWSCKSHSGGQWDWWSKDHYFTWSLEGKMCWLRTCCQEGGARIFILFCIHPFIQQASIYYLLCSYVASKHWAYSNDHIGACFHRICTFFAEKAMAPHSSTLAWKIP